MSGCKSPLNGYKSNVGLSSDYINNIKLEKTTGLTLEDKARLSDIPFIQDCEPELISGSVSSIERKYVLACSSNLKMQQVIDYYRAEMDYLGWREELIISAGRSCLVFKKPSKDCIIFIQDKEMLLGITLFVGPRSIYG